MQAGSFTYTFKFTSLLKLYSTRDKHGDQVQVRTSIMSCNKHKTLVTEQSSCISVQKWFSLGCIV